MKTIKQVEVTPVFVETIPRELEHAKVYISEKYEVSVHLCLCGCGMQTVLPLNEHGWQLTKHEDGKISFSPSIGNWKYQAPNYHAHYIITKNIANFV